MRRRLLTFFSALSLLLCLAVCGLWVRSYSRSESIDFVRGTVRWTVASIPGRSVVARVDERTRWPAATSGWQATSIAYGPDPRDRRVIHERPPPTPGFLGFEMSARSYAHDSGFRQVPWTPGKPLALGVGRVVVPFWTLALLTATPPAVATTRWFRRRRRAPRGRCPHCGYDLRATPNRCPECGRVRGQRGPS